MHSKAIKTAGVTAVLTCLVIACSTALYIPKEGSGISKEELGELNLGRSAYIKKCGSCHTLYLPDKYDAPAWHSRVTQMSERAKLTREEERQVIMYLTRGKK